MAVSYKKLWKLLIDKEMMKKDLRAMTGVSTTTMSRLSKDENVSTEILSKICSALNCDVGDIMEFVSDKKEEQQKKRILRKQKATQNNQVANATKESEVLQ